MGSCWLLVDWFPAGRGTGLVGWEGMGDRCQVGGEWRAV